MAALIALCGCASPWHKPEVSVANFQFVGGNLFEQRFRLTLRVQNPNDREIVVRKLNFEMFAKEGGGAELAPLPFATGGSDLRTVVQKNGETLVEVDGKSRLLELLATVPEMADAAGKLRFRLRGAADIDGYGNVPFDRPVEVDAARFLQRGNK